MCLDSGRNLYLGRNFYRWGPKMINRGGYPSMSREQLDSSKISKILYLIGLSHAKGELR